jgi:hypothetical protein
MRNVSLNGRTETSSLLRRHAAGVLAAFSFLLVGSVSFADEYAPLADKLTTIEVATGNSGLSRDMITKRFRSLLGQLTESRQLTANKVADEIVLAKEELANKGVSEDLLELFEGMNQIENASGHPPLEDSLASYLVLRDGGMSHRQAIEGLQSLIQKLQE